MTLYQIQVPSFSRDESATLLAVHRPFPELLRMLHHEDVVHGAYYALIWPVTRLAGSSELAVRFPSAVAMAVAAAAVAVIGRRLVSGRAGLAAGLVFAALPMVSWYGANARENALVTALATVTSYLLLRVLDDGRPRRRWLAGYAAALVVLGLANIFSLLIIPAHAITLAGWARRNREAARAAMPGWLAAAAAAVVLVSPVIVAGYAQRYLIDWIPPLKARDVITVTQLAGSPAAFFAVAAVTLCGLAASAAHGSTRLRAEWPAGLAGLALPWLLLPGALLALASMFHPVYSPRYIVFCSPALALLAGTALAALSRALPVRSLGWPAAAAGLALIVLAGANAQLAERAPYGHGYNIRRADQLAARKARPGDALLNLAYWPMSRGGGLEREMEAAYPFGLARLRDLSQGSAPAASGTLGGTFASPSVIRHRVATADRVWVAYWDHSVVADWNRSYTLQAPSWSRKPDHFLHRLGFSLVSKWHFQRVWLWLYVRHHHR